ncbi:MAG TPA: hypothetical protein VNJ04_19550 [Gemmatimonadaceae bacterium]|nr:hypothetical protein [Gemmatimonadaceae bacterium]
MSIEKPGPEDVRESIGIDFLGSDPKPSLARERYLDGIVKEQQRMLGDLHEGMGHLHKLNVALVEVVGWLMEERRAHRTKDS